MASVSVDRSNAMYALGTKTLTLPNQDPGWKSAPPTQLCNYHHNHCQERPDWACLGKVQTRCLPVKASSDHCWGCVKVVPLPTLIVLPLQAWSTHPVVPGLSSCTDQDGKPSTFLDTGLAWSRAAPGARRKPRGQVWTKSDRFTIMTTKYNNINTADNNRYKVRLWAWNLYGCLQWRVNESLWYQIQIVWIA